ncbi:hypothetical protein BH11ACT1_BH11ACT1_14470 [soil metagenome]
MNEAARGTRVLQPGRPARPAGSPRAEVLAALVSALLLLAAGVWILIEGVTQTINRTPTES